MDPTGAVAVGPGRRARRIADTKRRVAGAALDLFVAQGFVATTVEQICAAGDISRASFFRYFDNKEAVLSAEIEPTQQWLLEQIRDRPPGEPPIQSIVAVCRTGDWPVLDRTQLRKIRKVVRGEPALEEAQRLRALNAFSPRLNACLRERDPQRPAIEIRLATDFAVSWIQWAITSHLHDGRPLSEHFDEVFSTTRGLVAQLDAAMHAT
jgi:AcrR family transcriptional regulator